MHNNTINAAIQLVPLVKRNEAFLTIDKAIAAIQRSGLLYEVGGFETNIEGSYNDVMKLFNEVCEVANQGGNEFLVYLKLHVHPQENLSAEEKLRKFK